MKTLAFTIIISISILIALFSFTQEENAISEQSQECIDCHLTINPGIVADWRNSRHSTTLLKTAKNEKTLARRISSANIPESFNNFVIGCYECHGLNPDKHTDNFEHFGFKINIVVSPNDCATCHETEVNEYQESKKGYAVDNLRKNPIFSQMVKSYTDVMILDKNNKLHSHTASRSKNESCFACHGTEVKVKGKKSIESDLGEIEVPVLSNWPNMGVGRINPDGSRGACTSCHPRHSFSIEIARKPSTCGQCHLEPDVPAYNVYKESKHGTMYENFKQKMNFSAVPWVAGKDFTTPTCATCHNSLITDIDDNIIANRTHNFGSRLWLRIFGLPYAHKQPKTGNTYSIKNNDNQSLPTTFANVEAENYLIDDAEVSKRKAEMGKICKSCHGTSWVDTHFENLDSSVFQTNQMIKTSTNLVSLAWKKGLANPDNPFDEPIEQKWVLNWLFYANSIRYAAAMSGPDYAAFKNGWFSLNNGIQQMHSDINLEK